MGIHNAYIARPLVLHSLLADHPVKSNSVGASFATTSTTSSARRTITTLDEGVMSLVSLLLITRVWADAFCRAIGLKFAADMLQHFIRMLPLPFVFHTLEQPLLPHLPPTFSLFLQLSLATLKFLSICRPFGKPCLV